MNRYYQVSGDMSAEKSRDAYPYMSLCDECVNDFEVIFEGESTSDACEACGCSGVQEVDCDDCDDCNGTGVITECPDCAGVEDDCPTCDGREYNEECQECSGSGKLSK